MQLPQARSYADGSVTVPCPSPRAGHAHIPDALNSPTVVVARRTPWLSGVYPMRAVVPLANVGTTAGGTRHERRTLHAIPSVGRANYAGALSPQLSSTTSCLTAAIVRCSGTRTATGSRSASPATTARPRARMVGSATARRDADVPPCPDGARSRCHPAGGLESLGCSSPGPCVQSHTRVREMKGCLSVASVGW